MMDAVVIGSGHNALIAACYLAREGWSVEVLEKDTIPGGAVSTVERFPGHHVDRGSSAHIMIRHTGIIEDLGLESFGLSYVDCDPWAFAPSPPNSKKPGIVFSQSLEATCASIAASCGSHDARAYRKFVETWGPRSQRVMKAFSHPPRASSLTRSFWGLDTHGDPSGLAREFLATGDSLLDYYFDDEPLKAALSWFGAQSGPPMSEPGTAPMVGFAALMHSRVPGRAKGGSGALTTALIAKLSHDGGSITTGDAVTSISQSKKFWRVHTQSGREVLSRKIIAGCHILTTLELLDAGGYSKQQLEHWRRNIRVGPGMGMAIRLATKSLPQYQNAPKELKESTSGLQLLIHNRNHLRTAHSAALVGELPPRPAILAMSFSGLDPTLTPPGEHSITLWSQWHPYLLSQGRQWSAIAESEADRIIAEMTRWSPGFNETVLDRYIQTPELLESELGLIGGNIMHIEMSLDQMMLWRPTSDLAQHRVPQAPGFYITGASTHPGGGVNGASGASVAKLILQDAHGKLRALRYGFKNYSTRQ
ncbi:MAG: phytoene desaturase family protein [Mycobacteriaceae bacterium]